jgi:3',5'-cyclic-AMP phosphodiesterase
MLIAQITDFHLLAPGRLAYGTVDTRALVDRAFAKLGRLDPRPDLVVITGDVSDDGHPEAYTHAASLLRGLNIPSLAVPGNHDAREPFRHFLEDLGGTCEDDEFVLFAVDHGPLRFIGLDTVIPGEGGGALCARRLSWLEAILRREPRRPTLILAHHPPVPIGIDMMDDIRLREGAEDFEGIVAAHPQVLALLCGHVHRAVETLFGGRLCLLTPSIVHQVALTLSPTTVAPAAVLEPPAFRLLRWDGARLVSHLAYVEEFGGPNPLAAPALDASHSLDLAGSRR